MKRTIVMLALLLSTRAWADTRTFSYGTLVSGTAILPRGDVARSEGAGVEVAMMPMTTDRNMDCPSGCISEKDTNPLYLGLGGYVTLGEDTPGKARRNVYALHPVIGLGWGPTRWLLAFGTVGLDVLAVTTDTATEHHAGPTLGADLRFGLLGYLGSHVTYQLSASYLGAVAPGVGDNAGGLVVQAALGWRIQSRE